MATTPPHQAIWTLVRWQHGAISRAQLSSLGLSRSAIRYRVARGRLVEVFPAVYAVGQLPLTRSGRFMAAVLACGEGAALSHESAAVAWGIRRHPADQIDVSVPYPRDPEFSGI